MNGWRKNSPSFAIGKCVEVSVRRGGEVGVRDSKDSDGPVLQLTTDEWHVFVTDPPFGALKGSTV
jgi:hypothetical protein